MISVRVHALDEKIKPPHIFRAWASQFTGRSLPEDVKTSKHVTKIGTHLLNASD